MKSHKLKLPVKLIIISVIIFLILFFIIRYIGRVFMVSNYFKIKDIRVSENNIVDLDYLKGQNIFTVDLQRESRYLSESYPNYRRIILMRSLPNRIFVKYVARKPIAYVKLYRYFCLDEDLVLFDPPSESEEIGLPIISGLETKIFGPKTGKRYNIKELSLALNIITEKKRNKALKDYQVKRINIANPSNASIFLLMPLEKSYRSNEKFATGQEALEVKIGQEDIKAKINILASLFAQVKNDVYNIKYIDLRFKEPVIKFNDNAH